MIEAFIHAYWDVFDPSGALRTIRGYEFLIDTGAHKPTCCKPPRYGPHESVASYAKVVSRFGRPRSNHR